MNREDVLNLTDPPNGLKDKAINAGIIAGFTFFSSLAGQGSLGNLSDFPKALATAAISAGVAFFASLMTQLGLKKSEA